MSSSSPKVEQLSHDETEEAVMTVLPTLDAPQLETLYGLVGLELKQDVQGIKRSLLKGLRRHLDEIDDVNSADWQHYVQILDHLKTKDGKKKVEKKEEQNGGGASSTTTTTAKDKDESKQSSSRDTEESTSSSNRSNIVRFRDYKFGGTIGGEKGLSFTSIQFEIQNARSLKYKEEEIRAAVIRAIAPGHELRDYFEMNTEATLDEMIEMFRSTFIEHNSNQSFTEFKKEFQRSDEKPSTFVTRIMAWRRKLNKLSIEEGDEIPQTILMKAFYHVLSTGLRDENLRAELRERCRTNSSMTDNKILKAIAEIMKVKKEREEKLGDSPQNAIKVEMVDTHKKVEKKEKLNPFVLIEEMKVSHEKEMQQMRQEVTVQLAQIQKTLTNNNNLNGNAQTFSPANQNSAPQMPNPPPFTYQHFKTSYMGYPEHVIQQHWNNFLQAHPQSSCQQQPYQQTPYQSPYQHIPPPGDRRKKIPRCQNCQATNEPRCKHCLKCLREGHMVSACMEKCQNCQAANAPRGRHCLKCLKEGHLLSACPEN